MFPGELHRLHRRARPAVTRDAHAPAANDHIVTTPPPLPIAHQFSAPSSAAHPTHRLERLSSVPRARGGDASQSETRTPRSPETERHRETARETLVAATGSRHATPPPVARPKCARSRPASRSPPFRSRRRMVARRRAVQRRAARRARRKQAAARATPAHVPAVAHAVPARRRRARRARRRTPARWSPGSRRERRREGRRPRCGLDPKAAARRPSFRRRRRRPRGRASTRHFRGPPVVAAAAQDAFVRVHHDIEYTAPLCAGSTKAGATSLSRPPASRWSTLKTLSVPVLVPRQVSVRGRPHAHTEEDVRVHARGSPRAAPRAPPRRTPRGRTATCSRTTPPSRRRSQASMNTDTKVRESRGEYD